MADDKTADRNAEVLAKIFNNWTKLQCVNIIQMDEIAKNPYSILYLEKFPSILFGVLIEYADRVFRDVTPEKMTLRFSFNMIIEAIMQYIIESGIFKELDIYTQMCDKTVDTKVKYVIPESACVVLKPTIKFLFQKIENYPDVKNISYSYTYEVMH
jgi:hypothetical protein